MKQLVRVLAIAAILIGVDSAQSNERAPNGQIHAVIVAGSNTWYNYRHQSDACHAYHTLRRHGVLPENIIVMMYDDIAYNPKNPYMGKIFNRPYGEDVYKGLKIDYTKESVTAMNFINVLKGDASVIKGGNGRVLKSTQNDRVFIFYSGHGGLGTIEFPDALVSARQLNETMTFMYHNKKYGQLVFYLESCYSGSMFDSILANNINVYATTAAAPNEPAYAAYCDSGMDLPCLGDEFSVSWTEDSDANDINYETLEEQFVAVKNRTYWSSHTSNYGDKEVAKKPVGWFHGEERITQMKKQYDDKETSKKGSWPAFDVELMYLHQLIKSTNNISAAKQIERRIYKINNDRRRIESLFLKLVDGLVNDESIMHRVTEEYGPIRYLNCHHEVVHAISTICINFTKYEYALKYTHVLNNLCTEVDDAEAIITAMRTTCTEIHGRFL